MNNTIQNPVGIDAPIQRLQTILFNKLGWPKLNVYGRVQKNETLDNKFVPQFWDVDKKEYVKDVYINDKNNAHIFFVVSDKQETKDGISFITDVKIVFMLNLDKCLPGVIQRADAYAQNQAYTNVAKLKAFSIKGIITGYREVLNEFHIENLKTYDIHPRHIFAIDTKVSYKLKFNC